MLRAKSPFNANTSRIELTATKLNGVNLYMTVGKTPGTAKNEYLLTNLSSSMMISFEPDQNIYVVAMANEENP